MLEVIDQIQMRDQIPLFNELTQSEMTELESLIRRRQLRKKEIIFTEGSEQKALYFIRFGLIKTYRSGEQGQEHMISYHIAGDMLPPDGLFDTQVYPVTAECIVQTTLFVLPVAPFEHYLRNNPSIAVKIMRAMSDLMNEFQRKQQQLKKQGLEHSGQMFLLKLAEHCSSAKQEELRIGIPMTRQYFAHTIGSTQEKATLFVNRLRKEGIADMTRDGFVIHDVESLKRWKEN